jgi:hypothetical protein
MGKTNLEMMLDGPEMREADLLGSLDLLCVLPVGALDVPQ